MTTGPWNPYGAPQQPPYQPPQQPPPPYGYGYQQPFQPPVPNHPSAMTAMVLGIIGLAGIATCGGVTLVLSPFAWAIGGKAVKEIDAAPPGSYAGREQANAADYGHHRHGPADPRHHRGLRVHPSGRRVRRQQLDDVRRLLGPGGPCSTEHRLMPRVAGLTAIGSCA